MLQLAILVIFPAAMAFAACSDLFTMTISNRVALVLIIGFIALALATQMPLALVGEHVLAAFGVLVAAFYCFSRGWMGGGDAKLAACTVLWLGAESMMDYLLLSAVLGGALTLALLQVRASTLHPSFLLRESWYRKLTDIKTGIPYGIALAAAGLILYPQSIWMTG